MAYVSAVVLSALAAATPNVALTAPGHTPRINTHWNYTVRVTVAAKPVAARITVQIVDPVGGVHPVEFGSSTRTVTNWPFKGVFRDYVIWPKSSRGVPLKLRFVVRVGAVRRTIVYPVTPRA